MNKLPYVTHHAHGKYPAGTRCLAWRDDVGVAHVEFEDGVELAVGPVRLPGVDQYGMSMDECVLEEIHSEEDRHFLEVLDKIIREGGGSEQARTVQALVPGA